MLDLNVVILGASGLLLAAVLGSKVSSRFGIPALLLFLGVGMVAGSEGLGGIHFDNPQLAQSLGVVALACILFSGGMGTDWAQIRPVLGMGLALSTVGVVVTAATVGAIAQVVLGFSWLEGLLLGAIVSSTDAAAVFSVLRARGVSLKGRLRPLLELESGSNDPMAVLLTIALTWILVNDSLDPWSLVPFFLQQMAVGGLGGYWLGRALVLVINRIGLEYEGLYPVLTLAWATGLYALIALLGGNGFLAVYVAGLVVGNQSLLHRQSLLRFHDGLAWLMQIAMFVVLGLLVFPSKVAESAGVGTLIALGLMFVARPIGVFTALLGSKTDSKQRLLVAWVGLRGSVPIILATFPLLAGLPQAEALFHMVFFIVLLSVLTQGTTIGPVARWLGLAAPMPARPGLELYPSTATNLRLAAFSVSEQSPLIGKSVVELGLPPGVLLVLVRRSEEYAVPRGNTIVQANDVFTVAADQQDLDLIQNLFAGTGA